MALFKDEQIGPPPPKVDWSTVARCDHRTRIFTYKDTAHGRLYGHQCSRCGDDAGSFYGTVRACEEIQLPLADAVQYDREKKPAYSRYINQLYWEQRGDGAGAWDKWYQNYLASDKWRKTRLRILERDDHVCASCGGAATQVHHLTYDRVGQEHDDDLVSICRPCHEKEHGVGS